jgi:PAS domain S-box-containing protein
VLDVLLLLLLAGFAAGAWILLQRTEHNATALWVTGWTLAGASGILTVLGHQFPRALLLSYPLGTFFPALLLAGSFAFARRELPRWLLPAALALGLARAGLVAAGLPSAAYGVSLALEPFAVLAAGLVAARATPAADSSWAEHLLGPAFVVLAATGVVHLAWLRLAEQVPSGLFALWTLTAPPVLFIQVQADWERTRRDLRRSRERLEERVAERTAELAQANASLRAEVAERRSAEEALRRSEERYRTISELGSDLSFSFRIDPAGGAHGEWVTDAFRRLTGFRPEEMTDARWLALIHPEDFPTLQRVFPEIASGARREVELRVLTRNGGPLWLRVKVLATPGPKGGVRIVGAARDVTEARRAEEEQRRLELRVQQAQRLESLGTLTGGIAHDFNNLLAVILGNARVALDDLPEGSPVRTRLLRVRAAAEHGAELTAQMLAYSGKAAVELKPIDLSGLVEETSDLVQAAVAEGCELEYDLAPGLVADGDATQLRQVLLNLVRNASESLPDGRGRVRIRTAQVQLEAADLADAHGALDVVPGSYLLLEVSDTGAGMDPATQQRIFEPFFTTRFNGRGLGLAAVLGIVQAHHGLIQVESEPGRGSTLRVLLPERSAEHGREADARAAAAPASATVLVVDDDPGVLEVCEAFLQRAGHRVLTAASGAEGVACLRERGAEIDVVVLDLAMPDADGEQVLLEMRRMRPQLPVIIATGYGVERAAERLPGDAVVAFVPKPFAPGELEAQVRAALEAVGDVPRETGKLR